MPPQPERFEITTYLIHNSRYLMDTKRDMVNLAKNFICDSLKIQVLYYWLLFNAVRGIFNPNSIAGMQITQRQ
ncbi:TPA: hypothetical protein ACX87D_002565 [Legionella pneumophila]